MAKDNQSAPVQGTITLRWKRLPDPDRGEGHEFEWEYVPVPPIPDELAARLLREVANRL
jgi:hypothetical protein